MDKRKQRQGKFPDSSNLIMDHRIPHIHQKVVDHSVINFTPKRPAVLIRNGEKRFGSSLVLHGLNLCVKEGSIYCLIGASNSGKSTILRCITGETRLSSGELKLFGAKVGSRAAGIPGRRIGYMPQDVALCSDLTIMEALQFHGRVNGLTLKQVEERGKKLTTFLELSSLSNTCLNKLSPGVQKRTSLACSLLHEPELLVLDQPTAGMDILFQKGIWLHLQNLVANGRTSVILTTQNIEEARQAHRIGLLRNGRLLLEDSPSALMQRHSTPLLSEVVARLSIKDAKDVDNNNGKSSIEEAEMNRKGQAVPSVSYKQWMEQVSHVDEDQINTEKKGAAKIKEETEKIPPYPNPPRLFPRLRALFILELLVLRRNFHYLLFFLILPALALMGFCYSVGTPLKDGVTVAVLNMDGGEAGQLNGSGSNCSEMFGSDGVMQYKACTSDHLACRFLDSLADDAGFNFKYFSNENDALSELKKGVVSAYLRLGFGFASALHESTLAGNEDAFSSTFNSSLYNVELDSYDIISSEQIQSRVSKATIQFQQKLRKECQKESDIVEEEMETSTSPPDDYSYPEVAAAYKSLLSPAETSDSPYMLYYLPGIMILLAHYIPYFTGCIFYIQSLQEDWVSRSSVSGMYRLESLFVKFVLQVPIVLAQTAVIILVPMLVFSVQIEMKLIWQVAALLVLTGYAGFSFGILVSTICSKYHRVVIFGGYCLVGSLIYCGVLWPITSQYGLLQQATKYFPMTMATASLRSLMLRDVDLLSWEEVVWSGFAAMEAWKLFLYFGILVVIVLQHLRR